MNHLKSFTLAAFAVFVGIGFLTPPQTASAASAALSIVPKKNYTIEPGKSVKDTLLIRNMDSTEPLQLTLRVVDFTYSDDGGTPKLMLAEDAPQTTWSMKPFLTIPKTVEIPPRGSKSIDMSVSIPKRQGAGSYYSAIIYSSGAPEGGNVGLSASGVTLAFASIPGEVKEDLKLEKFGAYLPGKNGEKSSYKYFTTQKPRQMAYTLKNNGNVTEAPVGSITLKHMFGQEIAISDVNPNDSLALIGQTRTYAACIKLKTEDVKLNGATTKSKICDESTLWPGYYAGSLNLFYGQNGNRTQEIISSGGFWYLPWWFVAAFIIALIVVSFLIWKTVRNIRARLYGPKTQKIRRRR